MVRLSLILTTQGWSPWFPVAPPHASSSNHASRTLGKQLNGVTPSKLHSHWKRVGIRPKEANELLLKCTVAKLLLTIRGKFVSAMYRPLNSFLCVCGPTGRQSSLLCYEKIFFKSQQFLNGLVCGKISPPPPPVCFVSWSFLFWSDGLGLRLRPTPFALRDPLKPGSTQACGLTHVALTSASDVYISGLTLDAMWSLPSVTFSPTAGKESFCRELKTSSLWQRPPHVAIWCRTRVSRRCGSARIQHSNLGLSAVKRNAHLPTGPITKLGLGTETATRTRKFPPPLLLMQ